MRIVQVVRLLRKVDKIKLELVENKGRSRPSLVANMIHVCQPPHILQNWGNSAKILFFFLMLTTVSAYAKLVRTFLAFTLTIYTAKRPASFTFGTKYPVVISGHFNPGRLVYEYLSTFKKTVLASRSNKHQFYVRFL